MNKKPLSIKEAQESVQESFPFPGYVDGALDTTTNIARVVQNYLSPGATILDFGSGPCDKTAVVQAIGYSCAAFDDLRDEWHLLDGNQEKILDFARSSGIDFRLASEGYLPFEKESFDMIMSHDVFEHLHDSPREILNDLAELLKPEGFLFITVPNAVNIMKRARVLIGRTNLPEYSTYYWYPGPWRGHVREYVRDDLEKMCQFLGFEVEEIDGCHHMLSVVPPAARPVYRALTAAFHGWRDSWLMVAKKPEDWQPRRELSRKEFAKLMGSTSPFYRELYNESE